MKTRMTTDQAERRILVRTVAEKKRREYAAMLVRDYEWTPGDAESCALRTYPARWFRTFNDAALARFLT